MHVLCDLPAAELERRMGADVCLGLLDYGAGIGRQQLRASQHGAYAHGELFALQHAGVDCNHVRYVADPADEYAVDIVGDKDHRCLGDHPHVPQGIEELYYRCHLVQVLVHGDQDQGRLMALAHLRGITQLTGYYLGILEPSVQVLRGRSDLQDDPSLCLD